MSLHNLGSALLISLLLGACVQKITFPPSPLAPAAKATAKLSQDKNDNTNVDLRVSHLAPPQNLNPSKAVYVVWAETPDGRTVNLGQLAIGSNLKGRLTTVTPLTVFRLLVTAEDHANAQKPGGQVVLATSVLKAD